MLHNNRSEKETEVGELTEELGVMLLLIDELLAEKGYVRGVELAERLEMSRPTVTRAIQKLAVLGYAYYERYRGISLTPAGIEALEAARVRYNKVYAFLESTGLPIEDLRHQARKLSVIANDDVVAAMESASRRLS